MMRRCMTKDLEEKARRELNEDETKDSHMTHLKLWMMENYSSESPGEMWLLNYLRGCKFDQERAKDKLRNFYSAKKRMTPLYEDRDPQSVDIQEVVSRGILLPLYSENKEIILIRWANCDTRKITLLNIIKVGIMLLEVYIKECSTCMIVGHYVIIDCNGLPFSYVAQMTPTLIKIMVYALFRTYPTRIKGVHIINCFALTQLFYNVMKPFIPKKIISRTHFYTSSNFNDIQKYIPLSLFPKEYGGQGESIDIIIGLLTERFTRSLQNIFVENVKKLLQDHRKEFLKS